VRLPDCRLVHDMATSRSERLELYLDSQDKAADPVNSSTLLIEHCETVTVEQVNIYIIYIEIHSPNKR